MRGGSFERGQLADARVSAGSAIASGGVSGIGASGGRASDGGASGGGTAGGEARDLKVSAASSEAVGRREAGR